MGGYGLNMDRSHRPAVAPAASAHSTYCSALAPSVRAGGDDIGLVVGRWLAVLAAVVAMLLWAPAARADGIIIPDPPPGEEPGPLRDAWLTIRYHRVRVTIEDQIAVTRVDQEFVNEHDREAEGTYVFPLPEGASVSEFTMWVDGQAVAGSILEADEARRIYEDIVRRRRDPALLEYVGRGAVRARIFPIPPGGSRRIELEYTQVLPVENGLVDYVYPLNTERFSARPLEVCAIRVDVTSDQAMHAIYSPTHQDRLFVEREGDYRATVSYEETDVLPEQDFELVYTVSQEDVGLSLLTHAESPDEGFFLLLAAPTVEVAADRVVARDVVLVLDTSGSMEGEKLAQAKGALTTVLDHLNQEDRFNVIAFSSGIQRFDAGLRPPSEAVEAAVWVHGLEAMGGTNINRALLEALSLRANSGGEEAGARPMVLIFLTDGLPTEGVTEIDQILGNAASATPDGVRLFPFGVGDDVNTVLLDTLAEQNRGATGYVRPGERIDEEVSRLFSKIKTPVLTDVEVDFGNVVVEDVYPYPLPDLFAGSQLIVAGRYRRPSNADGGTSIVLSGHVRGQRREFVYEGGFAPNAGITGANSGFIPRLWATRKIGHLLTQIRLHGEEREWVDAVVELSVRYGIMTPYTSFLIEEEDILTEEGRDRAAEKYMATPSPAAVGAPAVEMAEGEAEMRSADSAAPASGYGDAEGEGGTVRRLRHAGAKTFVLQDGIWTDTAFDAGRMVVREIAFGSEAYFELLAEQPAWGAYLALGERVVFVGDDGDGLTAYRIGETGEERPTATPTERGSGDTPTEPVATEGPTGTPGAGSGGAEPLGAGLCSGALALAVMTVGLCVLRKPDRSGL